jgi:sulfite reductase beta subunit-like hemoprotein
MFMMILIKLRLSKGASVLSSNSSTKDLETFSNRYVLGKDKCEGSTRFLRIKVPNGKLTAEQFRAVASLSKEYGRGYAEITDRQNLQLHWVDPEKASNIFAKLDEIGFSTDHGGQGIPSAHCGDVRAVVSCPAAGIDKDELIDTLPIVKQLDRFFNGNKDFLNLPRKLKIAVSGCSLNCGNPEIQDLSFVAVKQAAGEVGFAVFVGGTVAAVPQLGRPLNVLAKPGEIVDIAMCTAEIFRDFGSREAKAKARFRWLVDAWGTEKVRKAIEEKMGKILETYPLEHLPACKGEHVGVHPQKQQGYSYINVPIVGGVMSSEKMFRIAEIAEKFGNGDLRLTPFQNIILANIPNEALNQALVSIQETGYTVVTDNALKWTTIACAGNFCGKTLDHPKNRAAEALGYLEERFGGNLKNVNLRISFSGCPNGCARHLIADIGVQGAALTFEGKSMPAYNLYVRNDAGVDAALGKLIQRGIKAEQAKFALANLITAYLKNGTNISFNEFCSLKSLEELQAIVNSKLN